MALNGGAVYLGANNVYAWAPVTTATTATANGADIVMSSNTSLWGAASIVLGHGVVINATSLGQPVLLNSLDLTQSSVTSEIVALQQHDEIGGVLQVTNGVATGGTAIISPSVLAPTLVAEDITPGVTITMSGFTSSNPLDISLTSASSTRQVVISGTQQFTGSGTNALMDITSTQASPALVINTGGQLTSSGNLSVTINAAATASTPEVQVATGAQVTSSGVLSVAADSISNKGTMSGATGLVLGSGTSGSLAIMSSTGSFSSGSGAMVAYASGGNLDMSGLLTAAAISTTQLNLLASGNIAASQASTGTSFNLSSTSGAGAGLSAAAGVTWNSATFAVTGTSSSGGSINWQNLNLLSNSAAISLAANGTTSGTGVVTVGNINTSGAGAAQGLAGASAGAINITASGNIQTGYLRAFGGGGGGGSNSVGGAGGAGNSITVDSTGANVTILGDVNSSGGGGGGGSGEQLGGAGGAAGVISIEALGNATINGPVLAAGGGAGDAGTLAGGGGGGGFGGGGGGGAGEYSASTTYAGGFGGNGFYGGGGGGTTNSGNGSFGGAGGGFFGGGAGGAGTGGSSNNGVTGLLGVGGAGGILQSLSAAQAGSFFGNGGYDNAAGSGAGPDPEQMGQSQFPGATLRLLQRGLRVCAHGCIFILETNNPFWNSSYCCASVWGYNVSAAGSASTRIPYEVWSDTGSGATVVSGAGGCTQPLSSLDLTDLVVVDQILAMQAMPGTGVTGTLLVTNGIATGGNAIIQPSGLASTLTAEDITPGVTLTMTGFISSTPAIAISLTSASSTQQVIISGTEQFTGTSSAPQITVNSTQAEPVVVINSTGYLTSAGSLALSANGDISLAGHVSAASTLNVQATGTGSITQSSATTTLTAPTINLSAAGSIGSTSNNIMIAAPGSTAVNLTAVATAGSVNISANQAVNLGVSSAGSDFNLAATSGISVLPGVSTQITSPPTGSFPFGNSPYTATITVEAGGNLNLTTTSGSLVLQAGAGVYAAEGNATLLNNSSAGSGGTINVGANSFILGQSRKHNYSKQ